MTSTRKIGRALGLLLVVLLGAFGAAWLAAPVVAAAGTDLAVGGADPATAVASAVALAAAAGLALVACWVATATTWCVISALCAGGAGHAARAHPLLRPWLVRFLVGAALGTTALAGPAAAATGSAPMPPAPTSSAPTPDGSTAPDRQARTLPLPRALAGLPLPDRPTGPAPALEPAPEPPPQPVPERTPETASEPVTTAPQPAARAAEPAAKSPAKPESAPEPASSARAVHTVASGESLWSIAADHLPPGAPPAVVDRWWRAVYDANRPGIGDDPDLIRPGTVLRLPRPLT